MNHRNAILIPLLVGTTLFAPVFAQQQAPGSGTEAADPPSSGLADQYLEDAMRITRGLLEDVHIVPPSLAELISRAEAKYLSAPTAKPVVEPDGPSVPDSTSQTREELGSTPEECGLSGAIRRIVKECEARDLGIPACARSLETWIAGPTEGRDGE